MVIAADGDYDVGRQLCKHLYWHVIFNLRSRVYVRYFLDSAILVG